MKDFTVSTYKQLLQELQKADCSFLTLEQFYDAKELQGHFVILRHDVDRKPENSLKTAIIENEFDIKASYYFRIGKESNQPEIIKQIAELGHEIGYHYENMDICRGNIDKAWDDFRRNLDKLRKLYPVKTICMHGSPLSKYDNRDLWKKYDYRTEGIIGEPYLDVDWNDVFYLTDTGRRWDGENVSVRDKVTRSHLKEERRWPVYHTTNDIIQAIEKREFPKKAMITTHPQRWTNNPLLWTKELVFQNIKNIVKSVLIKHNQ